MVKVKKEIIKIFVWVVVTILAFALYKTFTSILYKDWSDLTEYFGNFAQYPEQIIIYFIPYVTFKIISLLLFLLKKLFHFKINYNKISFILVISICTFLFIKVISEQLIINSYNEGRSLGFISNKKYSMIDSANIYNYSWSRNTIDPEGFALIHETLFLKNDTTVIVSGYLFRIPTNLLTSKLLFNYILNNYDHQYSNEYLYKDGLMFTSKKRRCILKIKNGKLETDF